jgi:predicted nucleic acid-binding protein
VIVIDSSALAKYLLREDGWQEVRRYLEEGCVTLNLAIKEAINALWKRVIMGGLDEGYAKEVARSFLNSGIVRAEDQDQLLEEALSVAIKRKITIYDSLFIALAKGKGLSLLTSDRRQVEAAIEEGVKAILV